MSRGRDIRKEVGRGAAKKLHISFADAPNRWRVLGALHLWAG
jgi:hypothetical protein